MKSHPAVPALLAKAESQNMVVEEEDEEAEILAGFGMCIEAQDEEAPPAKKRKTGKTIEDSPKLEDTGDGNEDPGEHTVESLGFDPRKKCRMPSCKLAKKVGQQVCGPHRKKREADNCCSIAVRGHCY